MVEGWGVSFGSIKVCVCVADPISEIAAGCRVYRSVGPILFLKLREKSSRKIGHRISVGDF